MKILLLMQNFYKRIGRKNQLSVRFFVPKQKELLMFQSSSALGNKPVVAMQASKDVKEIELLPPLPLPL